MEVGWFQLIRKYEVVRAYMESGGGIMGEGSEGLSDIRRWVVVVHSQCGWPVWHSGAMKRAQLRKGVQRVE